MAFSSPLPPPPVVVQQKRGLGCFGIGCIVVVVILLLGGAIIGGLGYWGYSKIGHYTSTEPTTVQSFDGGDQEYSDIQHKIADFQDNLKRNQPATLELRPDEINTLISRDPDFHDNNIHVFVSMKDDHAQIQASVPGALLPGGVLKGRYFNGEADFTPSFDTATKNIHFTLNSLKIGPEEVPADQLPALAAQFEPMVNTQLQNNPQIKDLLNHTKSIGVRGGKLEIEGD